MVSDVRIVYHVMDRSIDSTNNEKVGDPSGLSFSSIQELYG